MRLVLVRYSSAVLVLVPHTYLGDSFETGKKWTAGVASRPVPTPCVPLESPKRARTILRQAGLGALKLVALLRGGG